MEQKNKAGKVVVFMLLLCLVYTVYLLIKPVPNSTYSLQPVIDSFKVKDSINQQRIKVLKIQHLQDSLYIAKMKKSIDSLPVKIHNIKTYYNGKIHNVATVSTDSQIEFLSIWLSKESSNR